MPDRPNAMLVVERGIRDVGMIHLDRSSHLLGNSSQVDIVVDNPFVSRTHARIDQKDGRFHLLDLGSKNGTFVNSARLGDEGHWLDGGDRIELGQEQVVLRFHTWTDTITLQLKQVQRAGSLVVDAGSRDVWINEGELQPPLSRKEFDILKLLYERDGQACSRDEIASIGWPERPEAQVEDQEIDQYIRRLRVRIERDPSSPNHIITVRGYGYKFSKLVAEIHPATS